MDGEMTGHPRFPEEGSSPNRQRKTSIAASLALACSVLLAVLGLVVLVGFPLLMRATESGYCENIDHPGPCADTVELLVPGLVVLAIAGVCLAVSVGLLRRRHRAGGDELVK